MKVMEIITLNHWTAGSGYSCNETFNAQELDMTEAEVNAEMDWGWWEAAERPEGEDVEIVVEYFAQDENGEVWERKLLLALEHIIRWRKHEIKEPEMLRCIDRLCKPLAKSEYLNRRKGSK